MSQKIPIYFHNGSNYDYHFFVKELAEDFEKQFTRLGENTETYITFSVRMQEEVTRIDNNKVEITKEYRTDYNSLIAQDLWQAHYQIVSIMLLKEIIKLNVNTNTLIKNMKLPELSINIVIAFLNTQTLNMI